MRLSWLGLLALLLATQAHAFRAGQVVPFTIDVLDLSGIPTVASSIKAYVYNGTTCVDSTGATSTGISAIARLPLANGKTMMTYGFTWTIPTNLSAVSAWMHVKCKAVTADISVPFPCTPDPAVIPVNADTPDYFDAPAIASLWGGSAGVNEAVITPLAYSGTPTVVTQGGQPVQGASVALYTNATGTGVPSSWALSDATGSYNLRVSIDPAAADTFWVVARRGLQVVKTPERVIVP